MFINDDQILTSDDLATQALAQAQTQTIAKNTTSSDEVETSDQLAETLTALQNLIERNARELQKIDQELKAQRESLKDVFVSDVELTAAEEQVKSFSTEAKQRKSQLMNNPQVTSLKTKIGELSQTKNEIKETLSNHLVNYFQITNSKSFDTSDGDQWEFDIKAEVKLKKPSSD